MAYNAKQIVEHFWPYISNAIDLGSSLLRWRTIWTTDFNAVGTVTVPTPVATTDAVTKAYADALGLVAMTVEEVDGSPSIASTATLRFDQADGFVVTNPSGAIARVDLAAVPTAALAGPITAAKGGTNIDTSASTGVAIVDAGTWSVDAALDIAKGGTNAATAGVARTNLGSTATGDALFTAATAAAARVTLDVPSNAEAVLDTIVDAKGDLIVGTAADTVARKAAGTNAFHLIYESGQTDGLLSVPPYFWGTSRIARDSATQLSLGVGLIPIQISSVWRMVRLTAAITIANTGLVASTVYNVYAFDNAGTTTLELSTTGHTTNSDFGVEVKTGDATRTLVGLIRTEGSTPGQFVDSVTRRFVISWFNRRGLGLVNNFTADRTTTSTTYVEVSTEIRCEFLTWGDEAVVAGISGGSFNSGAGNVTQTSLGFDGTNKENTTTTAVGTNVSPLALSLVKSGLSDGYHYATLLGGVSAGTGTWEGAAYVADTALVRITSLTVKVRG